MAAQVVICMQSQYLKALGIIKWRTTKQCLEQPPQAAPVVANSCQIDLAHSVWAQYHSAQNAPILVLLEHQDLSPEQNQQLSKLVANMLKACAWSGEDCLLVNAVSESKLIAWLKSQRPQLILCMGSKVSSEFFKQPVAKCRQQHLTIANINTVVTYHPAKCLRDLAYKRPIWEDLKLAVKLFKSQN